MRMSANRGSSGFSLLELLIVVAIILIIATIAIPNLMKSRQAANETAAVATLRSINTAQVIYFSQSGGTYADINQLVESGILPSLDRSAGYTYSIELSEDKATYTAKAVPSSPSNGRYAYYSAPDSVVRYDVDEALAPPGLAGAPVR